MFHEILKKKSSNDLVGRLFDGIHWEKYCERYSLPEDEGGGGWDGVREGRRVGGESLRERCGWVGGNGEVGKAIDKLWSANFCIESL